MKINFLVIRPYVDGGARVIAQHARYLLNKGHDVQIFALGRTPLDLRTQLRSLRRGKWERRASFDTSIYDHYGLTLNTFDDRTEIGPEDIRDAEVTVATWWQTGEWLAKMPESKGAKVFFIQGDEASFPYVDNARANAVFRQPFKKIVVSQWLKNIQEKQFGDANAALVENAVDPQQFNFTPRGKNKIPTLGFLMTGVPQKNTQRAIDACIDIKKTLSGLRVVTFGHAKPQAPLVVPHWIEFRKNPDQSVIAATYAGCDAWLLTSDSEGFGLPILEAMASGTPVVSTRAGAAPQLVTDQTGALVDHDAKAIASAALSILRLSDDAWRAKSAAARARATSYSWDDASALFEKVLTDQASPNAER